MNKDSKLIWEAYIKRFIAEADIVPSTPNQPSTATQIKTFGDLTKLIQSINLRSKGKVVAGQVANLAVDQLLGLVPGGTNIKTAYEFFKAVVAKPDVKKTNTVLDKFDIDDDVLKIIDDTVEASFLQHVQEIIAKHDQNTPIPNDWNMTKELHDFIKATYHGRSVEIPH